MTRRLRIYLALTLVAIMVLTSQSMAVARGAARDATGQIVLCTGTGPVSVYVDEDGQPVGRPHICPDCALHLLAAVAAPDIAPVPLALSSRKHPLILAEVSAETVAPASSARGPPAAV